MTTFSRSVLIVEYDPAIAQGLNDTLGFEGFRVSHCATGEAALSAIESNAPDCMILDLMLPDINGYEVCQRVRTAGHHFPIIILTARGQESDKVRGLDAGADDYMTKPFSVAELVARIRAILRRIERTDGAQRVEPFVIGSVTINPHTQLLEKGKRSERLSFYEVELLRMLRERSGQTVSRDEILEKIWGIQGSPNNRYVDNCIVKLRKKLEDDPNLPKHILTVYGQGYRLIV